MSDREFDVIVLGAGPAGEVCAGKLAEEGLEVALLEAELIGGECSFYACMPSKALLRPAPLLAEAQRVPGVSSAVSGDLDRQAVLDRRDEVIHDLDDSGQLPWLKEREIELFRGAGRLRGERRVEIGEETLLARRAVVIATGTAAAMAPIEGLDAVRTWNTRDATTSKRIPASLIVLGGGPVGAELAQAWSALGAEVTVVEAAKRLLPREEPFAGDQLAAALRETHGVDVRVATRAERASAAGEGVGLDLGDGSRIEAAEVLVAVGRRPRVDGIGLESVGIEPDGFLEVDDRMRVGDRDWLYAVGDVNGRALLTHMGKYQARVAAENVLGGDAVATLEGTGSPRVTFTDPQVAAVGRTLSEAREAGIEASATDVATDGTPGASFQGKGTGGTSRLVIDDARRVVVGATFVGFETADFLQAATIAIVAEVPLAKLHEAVPAYPTRSEVWLKLLENHRA